MTYNDFCKVCYSEHASDVLCRPMPGPFLVTPVPEGWQGKGTSDSYLVVDVGTHTTVGQAFSWPNAEVQAEAHAHLWSAAFDGYEFALEFLDWAENHGGNFAFTWPDGERGWLEDDEGWKGLVEMAQEFASKARGKS